MLLAISYTTKIWLILWIFIALHIISSIYALLNTSKQYGRLSNIIFYIIELLIQGMFLYISYNLYKNPTESYTYVKVLNNSSKTNPK